MLGGRAIRRLIGHLRKHLVGFGSGFVFAVACFIAITRASDHFSTSAYCGTGCHEMHTAYRSWELSSHCANDDGITAQCIDCHLPSKDRFFVHLAAKAYFGAKDVYKHHFGETYDAEKKRQEVLARMPNSRCLACHDNLLAKPSSSAARLAHKTVLGFAMDTEQRCVDCHDKLHEREKEIFTAALRE